MARIHFPREYRVFDESLVAALAENMRVLDNFLATQFMDGATVASNYLNKVSGVQSIGSSVAFAGSGSLSMGAKVISNVADPLAAQDAATKAYVDAIDLTPYLAKAGGTMTGPIAMGTQKITGLGDPTTNTQDAATANWVEDTAKAHNAGLLDGHDTSYFSVDGHTHTSLGSVSFSGAIYPNSAGDHDNGTAVYRWDTVYCITLNESSDERLKQNIRPLPWGGQMAVRDIHPIAYDRDGRPHLGFSAQEVRRTLEGLGLYGATGEGEDGFLSINPTALLAILWQAVREMSDYIGSRG
jgi:hypothetical protein